MRMIDIILRKRNACALTKDEINFWISGVSNSKVPDYQSAALLMAICINGMNPEETADLTIAMANSGEVADLSQIPGIKVDKHSTGGVGDTTTLIVAPVVASCGVPVAKMSGRGLGHTGGTLDKLESIPGVCTERSIQDMIAMVNDTGIAVVGQSEKLVPADRALYALRDVTSCIDSIPLIASSIMSKKIASGSDAIVLDVKTGSGAFMQKPEEAFDLAQQMVEIGVRAGRKTVAIITDMNQPLGMKIGNQLEILEAVEALDNRLPKDDPLIKVCALLASKMLILAGAASCDSQAEEMFYSSLENGAAKIKLRSLIGALGGDVSYIDNPGKLAQSKEKIAVLSEKSGVVASMNAQMLGDAAQKLGAGRAVKSDVIDPQVGLVMHKRVGDMVDSGEPLCTLYVNDTTRIDDAVKSAKASINIESSAVNSAPMVYGIVDEQGKKHFND